MRRPCKRCLKNRDERFYVSARGTVCADCRKKRHSQTSHGNRIRRTYGITAPEYMTMLEAQGKCCAICSGSRNYRLSVDHDHEKERLEGSRASVRGLLCKRCNTLLANAGDRPDLLDAAAAYLRDPPAKKHL